MDELTATFAQARFGDKLVKQALSPQLTEQLQALASAPGMSDEQRKLRDLIEQSVKAEQRKLQEAKRLIEYGRGRLTDPNRMGGAGTFLLDALRAAIPGLSISASAGNGFTKRSVEDPERGMGGRAFDIAHALAALGGAGVGTAAQKGYFGGTYGRDVAERILGGAGPLREAVINALAPEGGASEAVRNAIQQAASRHDIGLAGQRHTPVINRIMRMFSGPSWERWMRGGTTEPTATAARKALIRDVMRNPAFNYAQRREAARALRGLRGAVGSATRAGQLALAPEQMNRLPGGWKGAVGGALLASLPFILMRLRRTRKLRESGGTAARSAVEKAERLLSEAGELRGHRAPMLAGQA